VQQPAFAFQKVRVELHGAQLTIQAIRWLRLMVTLPPAGLDAPTSRLHPTDPLQRLSHMMAELPEHVEALLQKLPVTHDQSLGATWSAALFRVALRDSALQLSESELDLLMGDLVQGDTGLVSCSEFRLTMRCSLAGGAADPDQTSGKGQAVAATAGHAVAATGTLLHTGSASAPSKAAAPGDRPCARSMRSWNAMHRLAEAFGTPSQMDGLISALAPFAVVSAQEVRQAVCSQCASVGDDDLDGLLTALFQYPDSELRTQPGFCRRLRSHHGLLQTGWQLAHDSELRTAMQALSSEWAEERRAALLEELHSVDSSGAGFIDAEALERAWLKCCGSASTMSSTTPVLRRIISFHQRLSHRQDETSTPSESLDYRWLLHTIERTVVQQAIHAKLERLGLLAAWVTAARTLEPYREAIESIGQSTFGPLNVQVDTFKRSLRSLGVRMSASSLNGIVRCFDTDGSGLVDCRAWLAMSLHACSNSEGGSASPAMETLESGAGGTGLAHAPTAQDRRD
jgi:hypothetical protein